MSKRDYRKNDLTGRIILGIVIAVIVAVFFGLAKLFEWISNQP